MSERDSTPKPLFKVNPCRPKRTTKHAKGQPLNLPKRNGAVALHLIGDDSKRRQTLSARRSGLFKKAYELNKLTGKFVSVQVGEDFWSSEEAIPAAKEPAPSTSHGDVTTEEDNPMLSPQHFTVVEVSSNTVGTQTTADNVSDSPELCRICGASFEKDTPAKQDLWLGCDSPNCSYWLHAQCLLGKSSKITPRFVKNLPFKCPEHK